MIEPIKPDEVGQGKAFHFPDAVVEAFNELILEKFVNISAMVLQKDVEKRIIQKGIPQKDIDEYGYLNVEELYRAQGWSVFYDKPVGYAGETFDPYFEFTRSST